MSKQAHKAIAVAKVSISAKREAVALDTAGQYGLETEYDLDAIQIVLNQGVELANGRSQNGKVSASKKATADTKAGIAIVNGQADYAEKVAGRAPSARGESKTPYEKAIAWGKKVHNDDTLTPSQRKKIAEAVLNG